MRNDVIAEHWDQLKNQVITHWNEISEEEINKMEGSYSELVDAIREKYGITKNKAANEIESFLDSGVLDNFIQKSERYINNSKRYINNSISDLREKSSEVQENIIGYVKNNPVKSIVFALVTGICAAKILKN